MGRESDQTKVPVVSYSGYFTTSVPGHQQCFGCAVRVGVRVRGAGVQNRRRVGGGARGGVGGGSICHAAGPRGDGHIPGVFWREKG